MSHKSKPHMKSMKEKDVKKEEEKHMMHKPESKKMPMHKKVGRGK